MTWKQVVGAGAPAAGDRLSTWYGTPGLRVASRGFARLRTEAEGGLVLTCGLEEKERLLESGYPAYYGTPHYEGSGSIIVELTRIFDGALKELLGQAWRLKAPLRLRRAFDAGLQGWCT
jgi:hypothetical protein